MQGRWCRRAADGDLNGGVARIGVSLRTPPWRQRPTPPPAPLSSLKQFVSHAASSPLPPPFAAAAAALRVLPLQRSRPACRPPHPQPASPVEQAQLAHPRVRSVAGVEWMRCCESLWRRSSDGIQLAARSRVRAGSAAEGAALAHRAQHRRCSGCTWIAAPDAPNRVAPDAPASASAGASPSPPLPPLPVASSAGLWRDRAQTLHLQPRLDHVG